MAKILFLTTAHKSDDDRIFFHQAKTLKDEGHEIKICSLSSDFIGEKEGILFESQEILDKSSTEKSKFFQKIISEFSPQIIIASEPLAVISAKKIAKKINAKIIYDITEWYPSKRMISLFPSFSKPFQALKLMLVNLYAGFLSDAFIFGEPSKKFPLTYFFPFKKNILLPYFPDEKFIQPKINVLKNNEIKLGYTGVFSKEKGIGNFFAVAEKIQENFPETKVKLILVGSAKNSADQIYFENLLQNSKCKNVEIRKPVDFQNFTKSYSDADVMFDLREKNFENDHCLPIKIFYYGASGKPVVYTDLRAIRNFMDAEEFGFLVNPEDPAEISAKIGKYIENPDLYAQHANRARELFAKKYNWNAIRHDFSDFVEKILNRE